MIISTWNGSYTLIQSLKIKIHRCIFVWQKIKMSQFLYFYFFVLSTLSLRDPFICEFIMPFLFCPSCFINPVTLNCCFLFIFLLCFYFFSPINFVKLKELQIKNAVETLCTLDKYKNTVSVKSSIWSYLSEYLPTCKSQKLCSLWLIINLLVHCLVAISC